MRSLMGVFQVLACCLSMADCNQSGLRRGYQPPPDASYRTESMSLTTDGASHGVRGAFVTQEFVKAVRERPLLGRSFIAEEHQPKARPVAILSHGLWRRRFGADPNVIGKSVSFNGRAHTVVGVMPKGFDLPPGAEAWLPETGSDR